MSIFEYLDYKEYVAAWVESRPKKGHGQWRKISQFLNVHTSLMSQVFKGDKDLSFEQAALLCDYLGHGELESDYFLLLVQYARAGNQALRNILEKQLERKSSEAKNLSKRIKKDLELTEEQKSQYYSSWVYSAVRLGAGIKDLNEVDDFAQILKLDPKFVNGIFQFLIESGLVVKKDDGTIDMGKAYTHLDKDSPWTKVHHTNWRKKAFERYDHLDNESELIYTSPVSLSFEDAQKIRELHIKHIQKIMKIITDSEPETLFSLGIDWFKVYA
ncbi:MAG: TIGR02147 family protein [Oligoflexia bacterium]|nr:TIGR02147 family protein [Oligoflexia bacterium]